MKTRHHMQVIGGHPGDDPIDVFTYVTDGILPCEEVAEAVESLNGTTPSQEVLTQRLADRLRVKVRTVGRHLAGAIVTTVVCLPTTEPW
jgi:hypothetical protein